MPPLVGIGQPETHSEVIVEKPAFRQMWSTMLASFNAVIPVARKFTFHKPPAPALV